MDIYLAMKKIQKSQSAEELDAILNILEVEQLKECIKMLMSQISSYVLINQAFKTKGEMGWN